MTRSITTAPLPPEQIPQALPLIQTVQPDLDLRTWRAFAQQLAAPEAAAEHGIVAARGENGYLLGLVTYRIRRESGCGPVLLAEHFVALDLIDRAPVATALIAALDQVGHRHGCAALHAILPRSQAGLLDSFRAAGYRPDGTVLCKRIGDGRAVRHACATVEWHSRPATASGSTSDCPSMEAGRKRGSRRPTPRTASPARIARRTSSEKS